MRHFAITLIILASTVLQAGSAQIVVRGRVVDKITGEPLELAVVSTRPVGDSAAQKGGSSSLTDRQGNFQLLARSAADSLVISFIGYKAVCVCADQCSADMSCCKNGTCNMGGMVVQMARQNVDLKSVSLAPGPNATFHTISQVDLRLKPVNSAQDLMRLVPGLFLGEHQGGGLAEHIFIRGFDADHGSDVNVSVDGIPVNLVSQVHGQGFADLHYLIPELVSKYDYGKGPYYAEYGDFTTAGYVAFRTYDVLDHSEVKVEGGQYNTGRVMAEVNLLSKKALQRGESAYIAGEAAYTDGAFDWAQHLHRYNLYGKYNVNLSSKTKLTATLSTYQGAWRSSGEIPERAVSEGLIGRFGYIDSAQGGKTDRSNVIIRLRTDLGTGWQMENQAYYSHYDFVLHYNPSFFAEDSINGDQKRQLEHRNLAGYNGRLSNHRYFADGSDLLSSAGIGAQGNWISTSELSHTINQNTVLDNLQAGVPTEYALNAFVDENYHKGKWLFNAGARLDWLDFQYKDFVNIQEPGRSKLVASPKVNVSYTVSPTLQFYVKAGKGFHSNDAKVVVSNQGIDILPAAYGTDIGVNWKPFPGLILNAALWTLYLQQEFTYNADDGTMEPGDKTLRQGVDLSARYQFTSWLFANFDINYCKARDVQAAKGQNYLPLAVPLCSTGGLDFKLRNGLNGGLSYRYMADRPANSDNSLVAKGYFVTDLTANYTRSKWEVGLEIQNLLNTQWAETQFETVSRMRGEPAPVDGVSFTPGTPFFAKLKFAVRF